MGSHKVATCIMDSLVPEMAQKVIKSVDNIAARLCETLQPRSLCLNKPNMSQKVASGKQTGELLPTIHARMDSPVMNL